MYSELLISHHILVIGCTLNVFYYRGRYNLLCIEVDRICALIIHLQYALRLAELRLHKYMYSSVIYLEHQRNLTKSELMVEIYSKSLARAIGKVLLM